MRKISEIYEEYKINSGLQRHMLAVAAVAVLICDNFNESIPKEEIVTACLLHDMGNIIKFNMEILPELFEPEGVEYWRNIQKEYIEKYGHNEHVATIQIVKELGLSQEVIDIADCIDFENYPSIRDSKNMILKIAIYADMRVGPNGILSYEDRMEDGRKRYQNQTGNIHSLEEIKRLELVACGKEIENQVFAKCKIKPEDITDEAAAPIIVELRNFVIK